MSYVNVFTLPGVTVRVEYQQYLTWWLWAEWDAGYQRWDGQEFIEPLPWAGRKDRVVDGWLLIDNKPLPGQPGDGYPYTAYHWNSFRVVIGGLPSEYEARITAVRSQGDTGSHTLVMGDQYGGGAQWPVDPGDTVTHSGLVTEAEAGEDGAIMSYVIYSTADDVVVSSFLIEINELPPFWMEHVLTTELI